MLRYSILRACMLGFGSMAFGLVPFPTWPQQGPIFCCTEINLTLPGEAEAAHGYVGTVDLGDPGQPGWNRQLQATIPTPGISCAARPYTIPLMSTMVASLTTQFANNEALLINANFFNWPAATTPHDARCGQSIGLARSGGVNLSVPGDRVHDLYPDVLLLLASGEGRFVAEPRTMAGLGVNQAEIVAAVSGIMIVRDRRPVCYRIQQCLRWDPFDRRNRAPRTAVGLTGDRRRLVAVVFEDARVRWNRNALPAGVEIDVLAEYFLAFHPEVTDVMMLDGSGSSALVYHPPRESGVPAIATVPQDVYPLNSANRQYRPVPVSLAFVTRPRRDAVEIQRTVFGIRVPEESNISVRAGVQQLIGAFFVSASSALRFRTSGPAGQSESAADAPKLRIAPNSEILVAPGATFSIRSDIETQKEDPGGENR